MELLKSRRAEMGVGTLIIFIALLLVAAVAAGVLLQTAGSLQQKALLTGTQATGQISTNMVAVEVSATDGSDQTVENFSTIIKLAPGSDPVRLSDVTFTISTYNSSTTYLYSAAASPVVDSVNENGTFTVEYLQQGANWQNGVLNRGDVARVSTLAAYSITESEFVRFVFIPKIGTTTQLLFDIPDVVSTERVYLYP